MNNKENKKTFYEKYAPLVAVIIIGLTVWVWFTIFSTHTKPNVLYILNVGQGDSQLIILASEDGKSVMKILIDGGKDKGVLTALDDALGKLNNKYIDLVIMTHADLDHIGGLIDVVRRYDIGMFISNGIRGTSIAYNTLQKEIVARKIKTISLFENDIIKYGDKTISILSPNRDFLNNPTNIIKRDNDAGLVMLLQSGATRALLTADTGFLAEDFLLEKTAGTLKADILKVGHHGSKYSSSENFIAAVQPTISIISVGRNTYGHPAPRTLETLALAGSKVYRTDLNGTIRIPLDNLNLSNINHDEDAFAGDKTDRSYKLSLFSTMMKIITGKYKSTGTTTVSLDKISKEKEESHIVPYKKCAYTTKGFVNPSSDEGFTKPFVVIINEVAWMGSPSGNSHEWIELRNNSSTDINMSGWQLLNASEKVRITFQQKSILKQKSYLLLARKTANKAPKLGAARLFTSTLRNSNEGLRLYDNNCNIIDDVPVSPNWAFGNSKSKQTMERAPDLSWRTSLKIGGTPGTENKY